MQRPADFVDPFRGGREPFFEESSRPPPPYVRRFDTLTNKDVPLVGGKNASLGEMIGALKDESIRVPGGFATTADAYRHYLATNDLQGAIQAQLEALKIGEQSLGEAGASVRERIRGGTVFDAMADAIREAYHALSAAYDAKAVDVAANPPCNIQDLVLTIPPPGPWSSSLQEKSRVGEPEVRASPLRVSDASNPDSEPGSDFGRSLRSGRAGSSFCPSNPAPGD